LEGGTGGCDRDRRDRGDRDCPDGSGNRQEARRLKVVTTTSGFRGERATATCPRGFVATGGGFFLGEGVIQSYKLDERRWRVAVSDDVPDPTADAQVVCAKGTGGFKVTDKGEAG
jgi:hypothetical protein